MLVTSMKCPKCGAKIPDKQVQHFKCPKCNTDIFDPASMPNKGLY